MFIEFLHQFQPEPILWAWGPITIYWYGLIMASAIVLAWVLWRRLWQRQQLPLDRQVDVVFWVVVAGLVSARLYYILLELPYYLANPLEILMPWRGGLAIHGAILGGALALWWTSKRYRLSFWLLAASLVPALAAAQALGRWGNYFNNEIYGSVTNLPWGIPIRGALSDGQQLYFHPVFLYESLLNLSLALVLWLWLRRPALSQNLWKQRQAVMVYLLSYGLIRFMMEFLRQDHAPEIFGWRWPQFLSLCLFLAATTALLYYTKRRVAKT